MKRSVLTIFTLCLLISSANAFENPNLTDLELKLITAKNQFGPKHPKLIALRQEIEELKSAGFEIDKKAASIQLYQLIIDQQKLLNQHGRRHPVIVEFQEKIQALKSFGIQVDQESVEKDLIKLVKKRTELRTRLSSRHPEVVESTRMLKVVVDLLSEF